MPSATSRLLSTRNLNILSDLASYRLLTTEQIRTLHFGHLTEDSEAPRMLMYRLSQAGLVDRYQTYARSTQSTDGLTITKPRPVWHLNRKGYKALARLSIQEDERLVDHEIQPAHHHSYSDQSLPHEIGLTSILMAFDHASSRQDIVQTRWIRTSPRHTLVSAKVTYGVRTNQRKVSTINPDAILFLQAIYKDKQYPYFFYIEYETGTASDTKYASNKLAPYAAYASNPKQATKEFCAVASDFARIHSLKLNHPEKMRFRVLTITKSPKRSQSLYEKSSQYQPGLHLFTDLARCIEDPLGAIWLRNGQQDRLRIP